MKVTTTGIEEALLDVRNAYRLLHDYQRMAMDAAYYVGTQLGFRYNGGWPRFSDASPRAGYGNLEFWSWDWLNMVFYEFHFLQTLDEGKKISFSVLLVSDTGFFESDHEEPDETDTLTFAPVSQASTKVGFVFSVGTWKELEFTDDKELMRQFLKQGGGLPPEYAENGVFGQCHNFSRLVSEEDTNILIEELFIFANASGIPLKRPVFG